MTPYIFGIVKMDRPAWIKYLLAKGIPWVTYKISDLIEGTNLSLVDSIKRPLIDFHISGNSIQDGTPSPESEAPINSVGDNENLLDCSNLDTSIGISYTFQNDILEVDNPVGASYRYAYQTITDIYKANAGKRLRFSFEDIDNTMQNGVMVQLNIIFTDNTRTYITLVKHNKEQINHIIPDDVSNVSEAQLAIYPNNSGDTIESKVIITKPKLQFGVVDVPYSPYNMGSIQIEKCNKNFLDLTKVKTTNTTNWSISVNGDILSVTHNNSYNTGYPTIDFGILQSGTYVLSGTLESDLGLNLNDTFSKMLSNGTTFTCDGTQKVILVFPTNAFPSGTTLTYTNLQLEKNSSPTNYQRHQSTTYSIYTQAPMRAIGDVRDDFVKQSGKWYERHKIGRVVFNGTETGWAVNGNVFYKAINDKKIGKSQLYCNYFSYSLSSWQLQPNYTISEDTSTKTIFIKDSDYSTVTDFQTWLGTHNTEVIYPLAEPTLTECTSEQVEQLENIVNSDTYNGGTNIYSNDLVSSYLETKYWKVR